MTIENAGEDSWDDEENEDGGEPDPLRTQNADKLVPNEDRNLGETSHQQSPRRRPSGETRLVSDDGGNERSGTISIGPGEHQSEAQRKGDKVGTNQLGYFRINRLKRINLLVKVL